MKLSSFASTLSIVAIASGALLSGCATPAPVAAVAGPAEAAQVVGSCAATVEKQGTRLVVCPDPASIASTSPEYMNAVVDVKRPGKKAVPTTVVLKPGQCQPLNSEITSATPLSCEAFAPRMTAAK